MTEGRLLLGSRWLLPGVEEPATLVTDLILAGFAGYWGAVLIAAGLAPGNSGPAITLWGAGFAASALAAAVGGVVHGFQKRMGRRWARPLWRATVHLISIASAAFLAAATVVLPDGPLRAAGFALMAAKLLVATVALARAPLFRVALSDHGVGLAAVLVLQTIAWSQYGAASAPWVISGIVVSGAAAVVQALEVRPHPRFNHNDLYHVVQLVAFWLLYRGGLVLG